MPPVGCRGVRTPSPLLENFQFFPAKIADFIEKRDRQIEKIGIAPPPPTFKKLYMHLLSSQKFPLHPLTFFFAAHPCCLKQETIDTSEKSVLIRDIACTTLHHLHTFVSHPCLPSICILDIATF